MKNQIINDKIKRLIFLIQNELNFEFFAFKTLISTLNFMMNCSLNSVQSEEYRLI